MTAIWSALDSMQRMAAILLLTWLGLIFALVWCWSRMYGNRPRIVDIPTLADAEFAAILDNVNVGRDDIDQARADMDRLNELDLKADDYYEWLELHYQWMGSDQ